MQSETTFWRQAIMVILTVILKAQEGKGDVIAEAFKKHAPEFQKDPGTITYAVHRKADDPDTFLIYEKYENKAALDAHVASARFKELIGITRPAQAGDTEVVFYKEVA